MDCAKTLMIEKKVALKYWREVVSITVYTLNEYKSRKVHILPLLNYGMDIHPMWNTTRYLEASVTFLKMIEVQSLMQKSDEGIFLGYSTRSKAYKCLNINTNKVVESANVKFDELVEIQNTENTKKIEEYKTFVYFYEGMHNDGEAATQNDNQQQNPASAESQIVNTKLQKHLEAEL